jgi:hypothetical protein
MFAADWLAQAPYTEVTSMAGRPQLVPRWMQGVAFVDAAFNDGAAVRPEVRALYDVDDKGTAAIDDEVLCYPFEVVAGTKLGIPGLGELDDWAGQRNELVLDQWLGWSFAQALINHPSSTVTTPEGTPTVLALDTIPMTQVSTNVPLIEAFVGVDSALTDLLGDEAGMILMSGTSWAWIQAWGGIQFDMESGRPVSPNGHFIVVEPGFDALRGPSGAAAVAGKDWIVGTPVIQWFHTALYNPGGKRPEQFADAFPEQAKLFNPTTNKVLGIDELWGIFILRPAGVAALGVYPTGA